jgi:hypothetical protein
MAIAPRGDRRAWGEGKFSSGRNLSTSRATPGDGASNLPADDGSRRDGEKITPERSI